MTIHQPPTLAEIREWARQSLGVDRAPAVWRALAHHPRLLEATWRKSDKTREQNIIGGAAFVLNALKNITVQDEVGKEKKQ